MGGQIVVVPDPSVLRESVDRLPQGVLQRLAAPDRHFRLARVEQPVAAERDLRDLVIGIVGMLLDLLFAHKTY